eukprot:symbB.v1.2.007211.t1/scaffold439.1/size205343/14
MSRTWKVVGGGDKGGVLVRQGKSLTSEQVSERLSTGAVVKELKLEGDRLHFELETGSGPQNGWVSTKLKDKELLTVLDGEKPTSKDVLKKKSWGHKDKLRGPSRQQHPKLEEHGHRNDCLVGSIWVLQFEWRFNKLFGFLLFKVNHLLSDVGVLQIGRDFFPGNGQKSHQPFRMIETCLSALDRYGLN